MRQPWLRRYWPFIAILVASALPYLSILAGQQLGPTEHIQAMLSGTTPTKGWDVLQADGVLQFWGWRDIVFDSWRHGQVPILNPYQLAGSPLLGNSQSGGYYPFHILFAFLPGSTILKMGILGILHTFIAGVGMFVFLRRLNANKVGAVIGALALVSSQFMIAWAPLASVPTTVAWIPWMLAALWSPKLYRGCAELGISSGMLLLAGHLQFAAYGLMAFAILLLIRVAQQKSVKYLAMGAGIVMGGVIALPQILPVLANSQFSHRKNSPDEVGYQGYIKGAIAPFETLSLINPKLLGQTDGKLEDRDKNLLTGFWPLYVKPGANPAEAALFISPIALVFAFIGLRRKEMLAPLVVTLLGILLAFGTPINRLLFFGVPGWSATGSPGRAHVLVVLGLCALAGLGATRLTESNLDKKWFGLALVPVVLLGLGFNLTNSLGSQLAPDNAEGISAIISASIKPLLPIVGITSILSALGIGLFLYGWKQKQMIAVGLALASLLIPSAKVSSGAPIKLPKLNIAPQERVAFLSRSWSLNQTPNAYVPPNLATLMRVHDLFGYDSILDGRFVNRLKDATTREPAPPENGNLMLFRGAGDVQNLGVLGVSGILQSDGTKARLQGPGRITATDANNNLLNAEIVDDGYDHQTIEIPEGAKEILIRDRYFDGLSTNDTNYPILEKDGFRLVQCKGNLSKITIYYPSNNLRSVFTLLTLLVCIGILGFSKRKNEPNPPSA